MSRGSDRVETMDVTPPRDVPAGRFSSWLRDTRRTMLQGGEADVPCAACNACCRSSYFIHIRPEEQQTLARVPQALLFPAPGQPDGHVLMGYDENGHCPMLVNGACSIYAHRPQTCRDYDCRIFSAAGISAGADDSDAVSQHTSRWRFDYYSEDEVAEHMAVRSAARFLRDHPECIAGEVGNNATRLALLAITVYEVFLRVNDEYAKTGSMPPDSEIVEGVTAARLKFDDVCPC